MSGTEFDSQFEDGTQVESPDGTYSPESKWPSPHTPTAPSMAPSTPTPDADWGAEEEGTNVKKSPDSAPQDLQSIIHNAVVNPSEEPGGHGILFTYPNIPFNLY